MSRGRYTAEEQAFYRNYLNSPLWRARKTERIRMAGGRCEWNTLVSVVPEVHVRCPRTRYLCCHHNTYERLGNERPSDLNVYCWSHHLLEHLLWKKCGLCSEPCLENEITGGRWLEILLMSMGIHLDTGPVNWKNLPNKEVFLAQMPNYCPQCTDYFRKD